jgi:amino acid transporter
MVFDFFSLDPSYYYYVFITSIIFFLSHGFSFFSFFIVKKARPRELKKDIQDLLQEAINRFAPMYWIIAFSMAVIVLTIEYSLKDLNISMVLLVLFMGLKTYMDLKAHQRKHHLLVKE